MDSFPPATTSNPVLHGDAGLSGELTAKIVGATACLRVLVALASYGRKNERHLSRVIQEYRSMSCEVHVVVLSNIPRDLDAQVEVQVGLPGKNPWSLPFGHKQLFCEQAENYDLFIYSEDDILITERNIEAFLEASRFLPPHVIAGFVHAEVDDEGGLYYDPVHSHFHWDPDSVRAIDRDTFAYHTNEHSACFLLTQQQLKSAIRSGGFLVPPHEGKYDMLCTAATDPYTQCGFKKLVCISRIQDFTVYHLPNNKYADRPYRAGLLFHQQIAALLDLRINGRPRKLLFSPATKVLNAKWSKDYYEQVREDVVSLVPPSAGTVLSLGCGWGATERRLLERGVRVVGIPMDSVIGACAEAQGVEMVYGDFATARQELGQRRFDCILLVNVLHLVPDPVSVLSLYSELLASQGTMIIAIPNFSNVMTWYRRLTGVPYYRGLESYQDSGIHLTNRSVVHKWLTQCGLECRKAQCVYAERAQFIQGASLGLLGRQGLVGEALAIELLIVARLKS